MKLPDLTVGISSPHCFSCLPAGRSGSEILPKQKTLRIHRTNAKALADGVRELTLSFSAKEDELIGVTFPYAAAVLSPLPDPDEIHYPATKAKVNSKFAHVAPQLTN
jgi:hypothetical protein